MKRVLFVLLLFYGGYVSAQDEVRDSVKIYFHQGKTDLDVSLQDNRRALDRIADSLKTGYADSVYRLQKIWVVGAASPEGNVLLNKKLSEKRATTLFDYLSQYRDLPDSLKTTEFIGRDWEGLLLLAENDVKVPYWEEALQLLREAAREASHGIIPEADPLLRLQRLHGGVPYVYMYRNLFPKLRYSRLHLWYAKVRNPIAPVAVPRPVATIQKPDTVIVPVADTVCIRQLPACRPFYMAVKTNLLYDALLVPNVGLELYLGRNWSVAVNWMYAWWKSDRRHDYWRTYGGDIEVRRWFGRKAEEKPLTGHHVGVYAQMVTYDFELGGRGYLGDRWSYAGGVSYGYSHPIGHRLNLDFTLGVGYLGGKYKEYLPIDPCYVWQSTRQRHWFGPTKAEVSLVWLIGCDNYNRKKGGMK